MLFLTPYLPLCGYFLPITWTRINMFKPPTHLILSTLVLNDPLGQRCMYLSGYLGIYFFALLFIKVNHCNNADHVARNSSFLKVNKHSFFKSRPKFLKIRSRDLLTPNCFDRRFVKSYGLL